MKYYIAKSQVSFTIKYPNGSTKRISFLPKTLGGSTYATNDEEEQKALERTAEENALIEKPVTLTDTIEIKAQKAYVYGDKIVQENGEKTQYM